MLLRRELTTFRKLTNPSTNPQTFQAYFPQPTAVRLLTIYVALLRRMRDEKTRGKEMRWGGGGVMTSGQGCCARRCSGKWDLGLVNTDESVWKLWEKAAG